VEFRFELIKKSKIKINGYICADELIETIGIDIKAIKKSGSSEYIIKDKVIYSLKKCIYWNYYIDDYDDISSIIIEIRKKGKLLYIDKLVLEESKLQPYFYINTNIIGRQEKSGSISVLNTNGNVLILRGIYYELWKILSNPISLDEIMKKMESSNFNAERINEAIHLLQEKGIVIENTSFDIDIY
jgi:hypothetical protein